MHSRCESFRLFFNDESYVSNVISDVRLCLDNINDIYVSDNVTGFFPSHATRVIREGHVVRLSWMLLCASLLGS